MLGVIGFNSHFYEFLLFQLEYSALSLMDIKNRGMHKGRSVHQFVQVLRKLNHQVLIVSRTFPGDMAEDLKKRPFSPFFRIKTWNNPAELVKSFASLSIH